MASGQNDHSRRRKESCRRIGSVEEMSGADIGHESAVDGQHPLDAR